MKSRVALLACAGLCVAATAMAEPPIGSRVGERLEKQRLGDERAAVQTAHQLAGCIVAKRGTAGSDLLAARSDAEEQKLEKRVGGDFECFAILPGNDFVEGVSVEFPPDILRGDVAEELLKSNRAAVARLQGLPIQRKYSRTWFGFTHRNQSVDEMAACVADTNPAAIMALVESAPLSDSEGAEFGKLIPFLGPCLVAGTKLEGKREPLRAALAEALYQRMTNPGESVVEGAQSVAQAPQK